MESFFMTILEGLALAMRIFNDLVAILFIGFLWFTGFVLLSQWSPGAVVWLGSAIVICLLFIYC